MTEANPNDQICLNPDCPDYRKKNTGHIIKKGFNAKSNQMFKCKTCGVRFPETKGTVFYNRHLKEEQIIMVCKLLVEKNGVRAIERIMVWSFVKKNKRKLNGEMLDQIEMATAGSTQL